MEILNWIVRIAVVIGAGAVLYMTWLSHKQLSAARRKLKETQLICKQIELRVQQLNERKNKRPE